MSKHLKLMAEYECWPIWDVEAPDNVDPATLPLSAETIERLYKWEAIYDSTLNQEYPPDSDFATAEEAQAFAQEGVDLWVQLRKELAPGYTIEYYSPTHGKVLADPSELATL